MGPVQEPVYLSDFVTVSRSLGPEEFKAQHGRPVLVGLGMMGELGDTRSRGRTGTLLTEPSPGGLVATTALVGRVWKIAKARAGDPRSAATVGRSAANDVVIPEYSASQEHCEFRFEPDRILIADLGSTNGTVVGGRKLEPNRPVVLRDGEKVVLGRFQFEFLSAPAFLQRVQDLSRVSQPPQPPKLAEWVAPPAGAPTPPALAVTIPAPPPPVQGTEDLGGQLSAVTPMQVALLAFVTLGLGLTLGWLFFSR